MHKKENLIKNSFEKSQVNEEGIIDKVESKKNILKLQNKISIEDYKELISNLQDAQKKILGEVFSDGEKNVKSNNYKIQIQLTGKNKLLIEDLLYSIGILYSYENENDKDKIMKGLEILLPRNNNTDDYILKIILKRRTKDSPFYIEKIEIINN